jgi:hypothetical protein
VKQDDPASAPAGLFTIRFYRLRDSILCDRRGIVPAGQDVECREALSEAVQFSHDFVAAHPKLGCLIYRPDGGFLERIPGTDFGRRPKRSRRRSALYAAAQLIPAAFLFWWDWKHDFGLILPSFIAARLVYTGVICVMAAVFGPPAETIEA